MHSMSTLEIKQIATRQDNYVYLLRDSVKNRVAAVDPSDFQPISNALDTLGWTLTDIINTHHHNDHTGGNLELKEKYKCSVVGALADKSRIAGIDIKVKEGDLFSLGNAKAKILDTPGHTSGHIAFYFEEAKALFCGDTLFALGCGRIFEGTPEQMWTSLKKLRALPDDTKVFCGHEYTQSNARFAVTIESGNEKLKERVQSIETLRALKKPTVPSFLGDEKKTNPFLRCDQQEVARAISLDPNDPVSVFTEIRTRKDLF